jgi:UDP-sulfoquinovose synthase
MNIVVLGGDGFCGWPTSLKLAKSGHSVTILDNLSRRNIDEELNSNSLTDIAPMEKRCETAREFGMDVKFEFCDLTDYDSLKRKLIAAKPEAIVHFAEQRAAPYSMISQKERRYTVDNNITATHNVLSAIVDIDRSIHLVHLGTMGVYGYSKDFGDIPEGYLDIEVKSTGKDVSVLYPTNPGSIYHMTKSLDQILFQFYHKNWGLNITDLHQGIVWGTQTEETMLHEDLVNRFDYDGIYGTVLNRFIVQAASGHPLSVYGTGGQTRAFIHINDTSRCVQLAIESPPEDNSRVRIFNQVSETRSVKELAEILESSYDCTVDFLKNPRKELAENELEVSNAGLRSIGFEPITLNGSLIEDVKFIAEEFKSKINSENINNSPDW